MKVKSIGAMVIGLFPLMIDLYLLLILPDEVPVHFDAAGIADRMGSKFETLLVPLLTCGTTLLFILISRFLLKRTENPGLQKFLRWYPMLMACILSSVAIYVLLLVAGNCI